MKTPKKYEFEEKNIKKLLKNTFKIKKINMI
jgi:hypothetical protein